MKSTGGTVARAFMVRWQGGEDSRYVSTDLLDDETCFFVPHNDLNELIGSLRDTGSGAVAGALHALFMEGAGPMVRNPPGLDHLEEGWLVALDRESWRKDLDIYTLDELLGFILLRRMASDLVSIEKFGLAVRSLGKSATIEDVWAVYNKLTRNDDVHLDPQVWGYLHEDEPDE
jgi:hypothetical protein